MAARKLSQKRLPCRKRKRKKKKKKRILAWRKNNVNVSTPRGKTRTIRERCQAMATLKRYSNHFLLKSIDFKQPERKRRKSLYPTHPLFRILFIIIIVHLNIIIWNIFKRGRRIFGSHYLIFSCVRGDNCLVCPFTSIE